MRKRNNIYVILVIVFLSLFFVGCRRASTRTSRNNTKETMVEVKQRVPEHRQEKKRDDDNIRSTKKLSGSEVFKQYGKAVFMIFTSDGNNNYQGSGFLLEKMDLQSAIIMYFKELILVVKI